MPTIPPIDPAFAVTGPWALSQADNGFQATGVPYAVSAIPAREGSEAPEVFVGAGDSPPSGVHDVILTTYGLDEDVFEALRSGAAGFLVKDIILLGAAL